MSLPWFSRRSIWYLNNYSTFPRAILSNENSGSIERFFQKPAKFQAAATRPPERELQDKLYGLFLGMHSMGMENVRRAYLADVKYEGGDHRLAICVIGERASAEKTTQAIARVFGDVFMTGRLDVLFVDEKQEEEVRESCKPFFNA